MMLAALRQMAMPRRDLAALLVPCVPLATASSAAAEPPDLAMDRARLRSALATVDDLTARWTELTTDCRYGEIRRELLATANKAQLIEEAGYTTKSDTMITMCKTTGSRVRQALGTAGEGSSLSRISLLLEKPSLVQRVAESSFEEFLGASERFQRELAAADAAAFLSGNDFSAQTVFERGATPTTPNLDAALQRVVAARAELATLCTLVS